MGQGLRSWNTHWTHWTNEEFISELVPPMGSLFRNLPCSFFDWYKQIKENLHHLYSKLGKSKLNPVLITEPQISVSRHVVRRVSSLSLLVSYHLQRPPVWSIDSCHWPPTWSEPVGSGSHASPGYLMFSPSRAASSACSTWKLAPGRDREWNVSRYL